MAAIIFCILYGMFLIPLRRKASDRIFPLAALIFAVLMALCYVILTLLPYPIGITLGCMGYTIALITAVISVPKLLTFFHENRRKMTRSALVMLILTILVLVGITVMSRENRSGAELRADLLEPLEDLVNRHDGSYMIHWLQNIALFVPSGIFFAATFRNADHVAEMAVQLGCQLSVCIETLQLLLRLGQCDINDITANTLGIWIGALGMSMVLHKIGES